MEGLVRARVRLTGPMGIGAVSGPLGEREQEVTWRGRTSEPVTDRLRTSQTSLIVPCTPDGRRRFFAIRLVGATGLTIKRAGGQDFSHDWEGGTPIDVVDLEGLDPPFAASIAAPVFVIGLWVNTDRQSLLPATITTTSHADWMSYEGELLEDFNEWNPSE